MATINGDQIVFLLVAAILLFCYGTTFVVLRKNSLVLGEQYWLWGLLALAVSYFGYGLSAWFGRASLIIANIGFLLSYVFLVLQLRFWTRGKSNIPLATYLATSTYLILFEIIRELFPYIFRATLGQTTILILASYLIWSSFSLYKNGDRSRF